MSRLPAAAVLAALVATAAPLAHAQAPLWSDAAAPAAAKRVTTPEAYRVVRLDAPQMRQRLASAPAERAVGKTVGGAVLPLPLPGGGEAAVRVVESSVMAPALQAQYPQIRTYLASGETASGASVSGRLSLTPAGFRGLLFTPEGAVYVDPYAPGEAEHYVVYFARDLAVDAAERGRTADVVLGETERRGLRPQARANGDVLRTYRLAVATTGEYTAFHGGTVAGGLAAIVETINRVTGVYERDVAVRFQLVADNDQIVYTDGSTDPYSNSNGFSLLSQNQSNLDAVIGAANYDVGHVFSTGGGGIASLGVICTGSKARGVTGLPAPVGDAFDIDYVAHELGHQFAANHTFNGSAGACGGANRNASTAYEPGSGSTIMAYAGICGSQNIQTNSDPYFHGISLDEITNHITNGSGGTCGTVTPTGNAIPQVTAPEAFTIPAGTPFTLTGSAIDDTPGTLTYAWEGFDRGPAGAPGSATPPFFRSFAPEAEPSRTFPQLGRLLAGFPPVPGETLPTGSESLTFRLTARDNAPGGGGINDASTSVTVDGSAGPFVVTFASTPGLLFGDTASVTWDVAGTASGAVNAPTVDILFSDDDGATFATVLAAGTPNDGQETVTFPDVSTTEGRVLIRAVGNVFFNVNAEAFTVTPGAEPPLISVAPGAVNETLAPEASTTTPVTVSNAAAPGAAPLAFGAAIENASTSAARPELAGPLSARARPAVASGSGAKGAREPATRQGTTRQGTTRQRPLARAGGPDVFGYTFADSGEPDGPAVAFQDISGTGAVVSWTAASTFPAGDEGYADLALPFAFPFYGVDRTSVRVFSNGFLTFQALTGNTFANGAIPSADAPDALVAPFWEDLDASAGGAVYAGTLPDGRFAVQYDAVPRWDTAEAQTFQVILDASGRIEVQYAAMSGTLNSATVGIENDAGTDGLGVVQDAPYVASNTALRFTPPATWIRVSPSGGTVQPGESEALTLTLDASGLAEGLYTADLVVTSNDPATPRVTVPVALTVGTGAGAATVVAENTGLGELDSSRRLRFSVELSNPSSAAFSGELWVLATLPDGSPFGPIVGPLATTLAVGETVTQPFSVRVPRRAPIGEYVITAYVGPAFPDGIDSQSSFGFTRVPDGSAALAAKAGDAGGAAARTWRAEGMGATKTLAMPESQAAPEALVLSVAPSPVRGAAQVRFALASGGPVALAVYDVQGREVARLAEGVLGAGAHAAAWSTGAVAPGVYVVRLAAGGRVETRRIVVVR